MAYCVIDVHLNMLAAVSKKEKFILLQDKIEVKKASFGARWNEAYCEDYGFAGGSIGHLD